jgi:hypothetical protein
LTDTILLRYITFRYEIKAPVAPLAKDSRPTLNTEALTTMSARTIAEISPAHLNLSTLEVEPDLDPTPPAAPARRAPKPFDAAGRTARGLELLGERRIVGFGNVYLVEPSTPGAEPYRVELTPAGAVCSCPDYRYRCQKNNANCKHGALALAHVAAAMPAAA